MNYFQVSLILLFMAIDITGTWDVTIQSSALGSTKSVFMLNQKRELVSGTYQGIKQGTITGTLKMGDLALIVRTPNGMIKFNGKLDAAGKTMRGTYENVGRGKGTFTAAIRPATSDKFHSSGTAGSSSIGGLQTKQSVAK